MNREEGAEGKDEEAPLSEPGQQGQALKRTVQNDSTHKSKPRQPFISSIPKEEPGRYEKREIIGSGGIGDVRRVFDQRLERCVARKELRPHHLENPPIEARFFAEVQRQARLQHPSVPPVYDVGMLSDGRLYFTMQEIKGRDLRKIIEESHESKGIWTTRRLVGVFERICETLAYAHSEKVVHRDLKPSNILVGEFGETYVADWGLAASTGELTLGEGTAGFKPPEQDRESHASPTMDVFALGQILHFLLEDATDGYLPLRELANRCTQDDPAMRPADASQVADALRTWLDGLERRERADETFNKCVGCRTEADDHLAEAARLRREAAEVLETIPSWAHSSEKIEAWKKEDEASEFETKAAVCFARYEQGLRAALDHDPTHPGALEGIADLYRMRLLDAERRGSRSEVRRLEILLEGHDGGSQREWLLSGGRLTLHTNPPGAKVFGRPYESKERRLTPGPEEALGVTPLDEVPLGRGSWLLRICLEDHEEVLYPVVIDRGDHWTGLRRLEATPFPISLPREGSLEKDDVYVPAGWFVCGGDSWAVDTLRRERIWLEGFVVKRFPVTVAEYQVFLEALFKDKDPSLESCLPRWGSSDAGTPAMIRRNGRWQNAPNAPTPLQFQPDWPIVGVSWAAANKYAEWFTRDKPRTWRLLDDFQWEKAARGVDGRWFPWGNQADGSFAQCRLSQQMDYQPTRVTDRPIDSSPYGVRGMAGNVRDWCRNLYPRHKAWRMLKGGCYASPENQLRCASRTALPPEQWSSLIGFRIGFDWELKR